MYFADQALLPLIPVYFPKRYEISGAQINNCEGDTMKMPLLLSEILQIGQVSGFILFKVVSSELRSYNPT